MENIYDNLSVLKKIKIQNEQLALENNITINAEDDVAKVLSVSANVDLTTPFETLNGECNISGQVIVDIVYLCENGNLNNQVATSPFVYKLSNQNIDINSKLNVCANVIATQIDKMQGNQIKILTTINFDGLLLKNADFSYLKEAGSGTYLKQTEKDVVYLDRQNCDKFQENLQATVKDGVKKILMSNVDYSIKEWNAGTNFVSIEGELYARILYVNNQEVAELQTITISKPFKQEIEAEGLNKDSDLDIMAYILHENIEVEIEEKENGETIIDVNVPMLVCYNVYICDKVLTVEDIYSTEDVLAVEQGECEMYKNLKPEIIEGKIEGNVILTDNEPRVDKFLAVANVCNSVSNCYINDGVLYVEGIASANVLYLNDELGSVQSVEIEIPYVLDKQVNYENQVILEPYVSLCDIDVMVKRGREIYFDAKAKAFINVATQNNICMVAKVESVGKLPIKESALEIFFAKAGQSFWDIAKGLKIPTETIANQNPNLSDPLEKDENIAIYYQKQHQANN